MMYERDVFKQLNLSDALKHVQESIYCITQTINNNKQQSKVHKREQPMCADMVELLISLDHVLQYIYYHAKSPNEIHEVKQTRDKVKQACMELKRQISIRV